MPLSFRALVLAIGMVSVGCASLHSRSSGGSGASPTTAGGTSVPAVASRTDAPKLYPVHEELNVVYGHAGGEDLPLDLFVPKEAPGPFPTVVVLHGGGWAIGSHEVHPPLAAAFASQGYVAASVGYRLAPRHK